MKCRIANQRQIRKQCDETVRALSPVAILSMLFVGETDLKFDYESLRKLAEKVNDRYDDISQGYVSLDDLIECLGDVDGVNIPYRIKYRETHTLDDAVRNAEYTQKAFATTVFASVLCDKFWFTAEQAQSAVHSLESAFDVLKDRPGAIKALQERYYTDYEVMVS